MNDFFLWHICIDAFQNIFGEIAFFLFGVFHHGVVACSLDVEVENDI